MKIVHVDGGAFIEPPRYKFHNAYFSVVGNRGKLLHFAKDIGDFYSGKAEYEAIRWAVENIKKRPLKIYSDCTVAIVWANRGNDKHNCPRLDLTDVIIEHKSNNLADIWNAINYSPKRVKDYYIKRYYALKG